MTRPGTLSRKGVRLVPRLAGVHLCAPRARPLLQAHLADLQLARNPFKVDGPIAKLLHGIAQSHCPQLLLG